MPQINLLPWREQARKEKKIQFILTIIGFVFLSLFLVVLLHIFYNGLISGQQYRNSFLQSEINKEQVVLSTLNKKKAIQVKLNTELQFILTLRENSLKAVHLLDELTKVVPDSVSLNKIIREGNSLTISGKANSNLQVTQFMKNMVRSNFFVQPALTEINDQGNAQERTFKLKAELQVVK